MKGIPLQDRIVAICTHFNLTQGRLAELAECHPGTIAKMVQGRTNEMSLTVANNILKAVPEINPNYLYNGSGPLLKADLQDDPASVNALKEKIESLTMQLQLALELNQMLKERQRTMEVADMVTKLKVETREELDGVVDMIGRLESKLYHNNVLQKKESSAPNIIKKVGSG